MVTLFIQPDVDIKYDKSTLTAVAQVIGAL